jgi:hypothetical protein
VTSSFRVAEQEQIARLRGYNLPDRPGFTFGDLAKDGYMFDVEITRGSDSAAVGTARGVTADEIV